MEHENLSGAGQALSAPSGQALLNPVEIRVLAVLAEKEALTPDNYPLSLNALVNGCNQLSSRDPVMSLSEQEVLDALQSLMAAKFVAGVSQAGARVTKYEHRMRIKWVLEQDKLAVLAMLMLRGPQTAGEIRTRAGRMQEFASVTEVEAGLQFLIDKYPPLVMRLARAPGTKEARYAHLLAGEPAIDAAPSASGQVGLAGAGATHGERITQLEEEVATLRAQIGELLSRFEEFKKQFE
jgi:uncharacterized protein YceH (UPF0502 family)